MLFVHIIQSDQLNELYRLKEKPSKTAIKFFALSLAAVQ